MSEMIRGETNASGINSRTALGQKIEAVEGIIPVRRSLVGRQARMVSVAPYWPPRREPCDPLDDRSRRAWLARRPRASAALSTEPSGCDFPRPDIRSAPAAPGPLAQ